MFTNIEIADKAISAIKDVFVLEVQYMHGDADHYTNDEYHYIDHTLLLEHANFLEVCKKKFSHGMGGNDGYWDVPGYELYGEDYIPRDNECCNGHASVESFKAYWIDSKGNKYVVNFIGGRI